MCDGRLRSLLGRPVLLCNFVRVAKLYGTQTFHPDYQVVQRISFCHTVLLMLRETVFVGVFCTLFPLTHPFTLYKTILNPHLNLHKEGKPLQFEVNTVNKHKKKHKTKINDSFYLIFKFCPQMVIKLPHT